MNRKANEINKLIEIIGFLILTPRESNALSTELRGQIVVILICYGFQFAQFVGKVGNL
jgi:hypothetical protein